MSTLLFPDTVAVFDKAVAAQREIGISARQRAVRGPLYNGHERKPVLSFGRHQRSVPVYAFAIDRPL